MNQGRNDQERTRHGALRLSALLGGVLVWISTAHARIVPLGPQLEVPTDPAGEHQCPQVVALPDGGFVVVWNSAPGEGEVPFGSPTFGRHFDAAGMPVGPQFELTGVVSPQVVTAGANGPILSWPGQPNHFLGEFTADGVGVTVQPVEAFTSRFYGFSVTSTPSEVILAWFAAVDDEPTIVGQRFGADLLPSGPTFVVTSPSPDNWSPGLPNIAARSDGSFIAVWIERGVGGAVWGRRFDARDAPIGEPFAIVEPEPNANIHAAASAQVCASASGDFVVTSSNDNLPSQFRRYDAEAQPVSELLNSGLFPEFISSACLPQGSFVMVGQTTEVPVAGRAFDEQNRPLGQFMARPSGIACGPTVAALGGDKFVAAWDDCAVAYATGCDVLAQRFELTPTLECAGDCNSDGQVTIDEILAAVAIALNDDGSCFAIECPAIDADLNCQVTIDEILAAVDRALGGCE